MKIKHSKYKNTGLIYELLVRQVASDTLLSEKSPAIPLIRKYFGGKSYLGRENTLYEILNKYTGTTSEKAETIINTVLEASRKLPQEELRQLKYNLIAEIKNHYNLDDFFSRRVQNYKPLAAFYCLLEATNTESSVDPEFIIQNKTTLLEHLATSKTEEKEDQNILKEYQEAEEDIRLLSYKLFLKKFNKKYEHLSLEQKGILKEIITSVSSVNQIREYINEELTKIKDILEEQKKNISDDILKIKVGEVLNNITLLENKTPIEDQHIVNLLQHYELIKKLQTV